MGKHIKKKKTKNKTQRQETEKKKKPQQKTPPQNKSHYLTLELESTDYQNEEFLIPSLPTAVGRFSFKTYSILLSAKYLNIVCSL